MGIFHHNLVIKMVLCHEAEIIQVLWWSLILTKNLAGLACQIS